MDTPQKPPAITPEQIAELESCREKIKNIMATIAPEKGGAACVFLMLSVTPKGRPEVTIDTNCQTKEEAATVVHIGRLLLPHLNGMPNTIEQAGAMMAGRDPFTGGRMIQGGGLITRE